MTDQTEYQIKADGMVVAGSSGTDARARAEAFRYAVQYQEEGEVTIQQKVNGRWRNIEKLPFTGTRP